MIGSLLAERYAKALFELALEQHVEETVNNDMQQLAGQILESRELRIFLRSPVINPGKKEKIIRELLGKQSHPLTLSFLLLLVRKRRESIIPDIAFEYLEIHNDHYNIVTVTLKSPARVTAGIREEVLRIMKKYTDANVVLKEETDESLIGGFLLNWKGNQYDASIRRQLNSLTRGVARINLYKKEF